MESLKAFLFLLSILTKFNEFSSDRQTCACRDTCIDTTCVVSAECDNLRRYLTVYLGVHGTPPPPVMIPHDPEEIWEHDLSKEMQIGASTEGYDRVGLRCGAESMTVELTTTDDFSGVIYTQGSFYSKKSPCYMDPSRGRHFTMNIPLNKCQTAKSGDKYSNVLLIQHDDELVTPGDAAFTLECDFSKPRDLTVTADLNASKKRPAKSSIALVDADPGRDRTKRAAAAAAAYVESETEEVIFTPDSFRKKKDEL